MRSAKPGNHLKINVFSYNLESPTAITGCNPESLDFLKFALANEVFLTGQLSLTHSQSVTIYSNFIQLFT